MLRLVALGWAILLPVLVAGCQSGAQQDLVARELRMQEDQIYAMENYLTQYQQLVCKYRSENAALRRRLAKDYYDGDELPAPRKAPPPSGDRTTPPGGTSIEIRETPGGEGQQPPSREIEIELPEVPPLEDSTSMEATPNEVVTASHRRPSVAMTDGEAASAAGITTLMPAREAIGLATPQAILDQSPPRDSGTMNEHTREQASSPQILLHGEVVENDPGAGPRLVVNVDAVDNAERSISFDSEVSLMLLAPNGDGQQSLARWDYGPEDVQAAKKDAADRRTMQFYLELPAETPVLPSTELWVRLVPRSGEKLLAHAAVDLRQPGRFTSSSEGRVPGNNRDDLAVYASANVGATSIPARIADSLIEGEWSIARPGEPANLPSAQDSLTGGWRASSEPIPVVAQAMAVEALERQVIRPARHVEEQNESELPRVYKSPTWSPERPGALTAKSDDGASTDSSLSGRPAWTATR